MAGPWVVKTAEGELGPFSTEQLRTLAAAKRISGSTFVRLAGQTRWIAAGRVEGVFALPKFPSKEDGAWSEPLEDTEELTAADATVDEDAILRLLGDVRRTVPETETPISVPPPPKVSGKAVPALAEGRQKAAHAAHTAVSAPAEKDPPGRALSRVRLAVVSVAALAGIVLMLDLAVRFALTMATDESQQAVGLVAGVAAPLLWDAGVLLTLLALGTLPLFWLVMLVHCLKYETRGGVEKLTWTLVLLSLNILGAILYYAIERPRVEAERS